MRNATAIDIVKRLTGRPSVMTSEVPSALGLGTGIAQLSVSAAVDDAIEQGFVRVAEMRGRVRFLGLAEGISYCRTCIVGCDDETESCGHLGCWGPDATNDCVGVKFARVAVLNQAEWAEIDGEQPGERVA